MILDDELIIQIIKEEYTRRVSENLKALRVNKKGKKENLLQPELKVKLSNNDEKRNLPAGTLYTIDSVGSDCVVLRRDKIDSDPAGPDSYESTTRSVSYEELEKQFELD